MDEEDTVFTSREIITLIEKFLSKRTESEDSGFAKVTQQDMHDLSEIIYKIIEAKWGRDADGDLPVKYDLTDWTKYQPMYWDKVPHRSKDFPGHIKAIVNNLEYASRESYQVLRLVDYFNKDTREIIEYAATNHPDLKFRMNAENIVDNWFKPKEE